MAHCSVTAVLLKQCYKMSVSEDYVSTSLLVASWLLVVLILVLVVGLFVFVLVV